MSAPSSVPTGVTQDGIALLRWLRFEKALANETAFEAALDNWLAQRKRRQVLAAAASECVAAAGTRNRRKQWT